LSYRRIDADGELQPILLQPSAAPISARIEAVPLVVHFGWLLCKGIGKYDTFEQMLGRAGKIVYEDKRQKKTPLREHVQLAN
jgi:hypothetical protein